MSLIWLRAQMRKRRHQAGSVAVLLVVSAAVVVHHFEPSETHGVAAPAAAHGEHGAPEPAMSIDATAIAMCLAVLPVLALLALATAIGVAPRHVALRLAPLAAPPHGHPRPPAKASRAGPQVLCVMRC